LSSRSTQLLLVHKCFATPVGTSNFTFFYQWTTPLLRNCNFASLLKGLQWLIITFLPPGCPKCCKFECHCRSWLNKSGFKCKIALANFRIALISALSFKLVYRWVLEKESDDFLTGIVLTVWGLCWYNSSIRLPFCLFTILLLFYSVPLIPFYSSILLLFYSFVLLFLLLFYPSTLRFLTLLSIYSSFSSSCTLFLFYPFTLLFFSSFMLLTLLSFYSSIRLFF